MQLTYTDTKRERLDKFLLRSFPDFSRNQIQKFIAHDGITVNGKKATIHHWLKEGDCIEGMNPQHPEKKIMEHIVEKPRIIEQTEHFALILKPAGLLIHPTEHNEEHTMIQWLQEQFPHISTVGDDPKRPGIVHRLDKDVGGLVLVALDQKTFEYFKGLFQEHAIIKKYYCLVHGTLQQDEGQIDTPIERSRTKGRMIAQSNYNSGKHAVTTFTVLKRFRKYTLLDVQILTGRTHQIRTHFFSIGHSIVGDPLYQTKDIKKKKRAAELARPFLFAYYLHFSDQDGIPHTYDIELPPHLHYVLTTITERA